MTRPRAEPLLTLEPLMEAVREGVEAAGWELSGLQKTTSHDFAGRWEGESTRSAYLFFHREEGPDYASVDVYLDETSRGLTGNVALVLDLVALAELGSPRDALASLGRLAAGSLPRGHRTPVTLRLRLESGDDDPQGAETEARLKLRIPSRSIAAGGAEVRRLATDTVRAFERILASPELARFVDAG